MYTQHEALAEYRKNLAENIYSCMEMSKQSYTDTVLMPVKRFQDYLKWKSELEEERSRLMDEEVKKNR